MGPIVDMNVIGKMVFLLAFVGALGIVGYACDMIPTRLRNLEKAKFNVLFGYPNGEEERLGQVTGLSACQALAYQRAQSLGLLYADWGYVCCLKTRRSGCAEKHR